MAACTDTGDETFKEEGRKDVEESYLYGSDELFEDIFILSPPVANLSVEERFGKLDIFKRPLCLVFTDSAMNLRIDDSVLHQISRIDVPISVVGVCGVYRTGKSYLMNILAQEKTGFSVGSTIRSHTKGIWAWCKPHPTVKDQVLILLDTEGLADNTKGKKDDDIKLFCLTMLMSSALIYNAKGVIDEDALEKLSFVADLAKQVSVAGRRYSNEEEDKNLLQIVSPHFVLCLRDFYLELVDDGEMTPDEYMESCLTESKNKENDEFDITRRSIKTFFPKRTCFTLSQPAINKQLRYLETLNQEALDSHFRKDVIKLKTFVYNLEPKCLDQITRKLWDGNAFDAFLRTYIRDLSNRKKLEYGNAMQAAARYHNSKLKVIVCRKYEERLDKLKLPEQSKLKLMDIALRIMHELLREFREKAYPYLVIHFEDKAAVTMKGMMDDLVNKNNLEVIAICYDYLKRKHEKMMENNRIKYHTKDGILKYEKDFDELLQNFDITFIKYDSAERSEALQKFYDSIKWEVTEMKYEAKLRGKISKYETMQKTQPVEFDKRTKDGLTKFKEEQEKKTKTDHKFYGQRMFQSVPVNTGFFNRLKFLFTGKLDVE